MTTTDLQALRDRAAKLRVEAETSASYSEYPRLAKAYRLGLADALEAQAAALEQHSADADLHGAERETRKRRRIARLNLLAAAALVESCETDLAELAIAQRRPFGQPILVGHHSERGHRRDLDRQWKLTDKAAALRTRAARLRDKAKAAANNRAIYSNDSEAVDKIKRKIASLEQLRDDQKALNAAFRKAKGDIDKIEGLSDVQRETMKIERATWFMGPDRWRPAKGYSLTNIGAELRRLEKRLEELKAREQHQERPERTIGDVVVRDNLEFHKVELHFPGKPSEEIRSGLKARGFRWVRSAGCWARSIDNATEYHLQWLAEALGTCHETR